MNDTHTEQLIVTKVQRLEELELQQAHHGPLTPPYISMELKDLRKEIVTLRHQRTQLIFQARDLDVQPPPPTQGLILLVSPLRSNDPLHMLSTYQAIDYHRPSLLHCWLIATSGLSGSLATADALTQHFGNYRLHCTVHTISNGADAAETLKLVAWIYLQIAQEAALAQADVIADITGGTKAMAAGMVLACGTSRPMQYMLFQPAPAPSLPVLLRL